ncbi:ZIP family metal transporter [Rhodoferax sp.]|uniref:ZIP family metal transporter n=1 Tax=Rhodoferax sp. TaxID=50421 RepID=UPI002728A2F2|nr:ZIP family metal transporter [Rhodoferax sp.]MDO9145358.1 ZIP family metal transporter [Rhodoferax sp.]
MLRNRFLTTFVCERDPDKKDYVIGVVPMLGIGFHSLIDGFIYQIAFTVSILTGYLATLGMVLHEFPEGIITYLLLVRSGFSERKAAALVYVGATHLLPRAEQEKKRDSVVALAGGVLVAMIIVMSKA